jgi:hypothetical protein
MSSRRRRGNRDRTLPLGIATAANAFGPKYELLISRAMCLTGNLSHIPLIWLASQAVPDGVDLMEAASHVRVVRRSVTVPRFMRDRMVKQINDCGWRAAYSILDGDDLVVISGWDWQHPKLPGSNVVPRLLVDDICLLKDWRSRGDDPQQKRRMTLTLQRLNNVVIELGIPADDPAIQLPRTGRPAFGLAPSPKNGMRDFDHVRGRRRLGNAWGIVADDWDIAPPRREQEYQCRHIARHLGVNVETERRRIEGLNDRHAAWLESITGKTIEVADYTGDGHAVGDMADQTAATDMTFEHVGYRIDDRRNRENEFLEPTEKLLTKGKRKGKTYRPNKAGPCRTLIKRGIRLDGWASWHALFDASRGVKVEGWAAIFAPFYLVSPASPYRMDRPPKKGSQYFDKLKPTAPKEPGLFGSSRTAPIEVYGSDYKADQDLQDTQTYDASARRSRRKDPFNPRVSPRPCREIDVPDDWGIPFGEAGHSYADELMTFAAKKPIDAHDQEADSTDKEAVSKRMADSKRMGRSFLRDTKHEYDVRSAAWDIRLKPIPSEIPIPYHKAYAIEQKPPAIVFKS